MEYILIFITAIFVNNIVLSQFLGICPFLGVSKKVETAMGMGAAVAFVLVLATIVTYVIQKFVLDAFGLGYLQTIAFILVIAALVQMVEIILKKVSPSLYQAERLRSAYRCCLCFLYSIRFCTCSYSICRNPRATQPRKHTERYAGNVYSPCYSRFAGYGIYGLLRC